MKQKSILKTILPIIFIAFFSFTLSAEDAIDFKLNLIEGQVMNYQTKCTSKSVATYVEDNENKKDDVDVTIVSGIKEIVKSKDNDTYVIQSNIYDLKIDVTTEEGELKIDYYNEDPSKKISYNFKDKDEESQVKESVEEAINGFSSILNNNNFESIITDKNEAILKDMFIVIESLFPKTPVNVGDTWKINYDKNALPFKLVINVTFKDKKDGKIFIEYEGKANIDDSLRDSFGLLSFDADFSGQNILDDSSFLNIESKINYKCFIKAEEKEEDDDEPSESSFSIDGVLEKKLIK